MANESSRETGIIKMSKLKQKIIKIGTKVVLPLTLTTMVGVGINDGMDFLIQTDGETDISLRTHNYAKHMERLYSYTDHLSGENRAEAIERIDQAYGKHIAAFHYEIEINPEGDFELVGGKLKCQKN
ncbi:hypothetical protein HN953_02885 [Candidatus Woesearchaeota archaeon]|nr:hypothetical protein [Candidatus Woesearchaeota archaeon]